MFRDRSSFARSCGTASTVESASSSTPASTSISFPNSYAQVISMLPIRRFRSQLMCLVNLKLSRQNKFTPIDVTSAVNLISSDKGSTQRDVVTRHCKHALTGLKRLRDPTTSRVRRSVCSTIRFSS